MLHEHRTTQSQGPSRGHDLHQGLSGANKVFNKPLACSRLCNGRMDEMPALRTWLGHEAHGELVLEHDDGGAERGPVCQQAKRERAADLVRDVGDAHVKIWQLHLQAELSLYLGLGQNP